MGEPPVTEESPTRCGHVAVLGAPNAGKSTLVNRLVGAKVSIVSPKVQTTRMRVLGIQVLGRTQILYIDTPGIFRPRRRLDRAMVAAAWRGAGDADLVLLLVDAAAGITPEVEAIVARLTETGAPTALVLNKIDLVKHEVLLGLARRLAAMHGFTKVFMISGQSGDGVTDLESWLSANLPEGPFLYPEENISDLPSRLLAAEITREQLYLQLHDELPYEATVETEAWEERADGSVVIRQVVYVARPGQKAIVLGHGGRRIKTIGERARRELAVMLDRKVHLFLFVKEREAWQEDRERYRAIGLDFDS